jgi:hypothetical protein
VPSPTPRSMGGHLPSLAILSWNGLVFMRGLALDGAQAEALQDELEEFVNRKAEENPIRNLSWWAHQDSNLEPTDYESA